MRLSVVLANVLSSTALVACGGQTVTDPFSPPVEDAGTSSPGPVKPADAAVPTLPTPLPPPHPTDAGPKPTKPDAGCATPPTLVGTGSCQETFYQACGIPAGVNAKDGLSQAECDIVCGNVTGQPRKYWGCNEHLTDDLPSPSFDCYTCVEGRRPAGYDDTARAPSTVAEWLAHAADLERVSIDAFRILGRELAAHGAPSALVAAAAAAEVDEIRHTRMLARFAQREGATLLATPVVHGPTRSLLEIALENAVEGCVRETYGALVAGHQATRAARRDLRLAMKSIYRDETAHAQLAWDIHAWIAPRLSAAERDEVSAAMRRAVDDLAHSCRRTDGSRREMFAALGLPAPPTALAMVEELDARLFGAACAA